MDIGTFEEDPMEGNLLHLQGPYTVHQRKGTSIRSNAEKASHFRIIDCERMITMKDSPQWDSAYYQENLHLQDFIMEITRKSRWDLTGQHRVPCT